MTIIVLYHFHNYNILFKIDLFLFWFVQKKLVLQVKELNISGVRIPEDFAQLVAKSISNYGNLKLSNCKISEPALEEFRAILKEKLVSN